MSLRAITINLSVADETALRDLVAYLSSNRNPDGRAYIRADEKAALSRIHHQISVTR